MSKESIEQVISADAEKRALERVANAEIPIPKPGESVYQLGARLFIRTVTYHYVGKVSFISDTEIILIEASWVADSGRFNSALKTGNLKEVEPYVGPCSVSRAAIVDATTWTHDLPVNVK